MDAKAKLEDLAMMAAQFNELATPTSGVENPFFSAAPNLWGRVTINNEDTFERLREAAEVAALCEHCNFGGREWRSSFRYRDVEFCMYSDAPLVPFKPAADA